MKGSWINGLLAGDGNERIIGAGAKEGVKEKDRR